jgi:hypothetical protein
MRCDEGYEVVLRVLEYIDDFGKSLAQQRTGYADTDIVKLFVRDSSGSGTIDLGSSIWEILFGQSDLQTTALTLEERNIAATWIDSVTLDFSALGTPNHYLSPEFVASWQPPRIWALQLLDQLCLPQDSKRVGKTCIKQHRVR